MARGCLRLGAGAAMVEGTQRRLWLETAFAYTNMASARITNKRGGAAAKVHVRPTPTRSAYRYRAPLCQGRCASGFRGDRAIRGRRVLDCRCARRSVVPGNGSVATIGSGAIQIERNETPTHTLIGMLGLLT